jgi:hypothetical protein
MMGGGGNEFEEISDRRGNDRRTGGFGFEKGREHCKVK